MTELQFERWRDFALRMARTCYAVSRRPSCDWIVGLVEEFFDLLDDADIPCIVDWDNSTDYPEGNPHFGREYSLSWCGCDGYRHTHGKPNPQCEECNGSGLHHALYRAQCAGDMVTMFLDDYAVGWVKCRVCSSDDELRYEPRLGAATGKYRVVCFKDEDVDFSDPGCDCPGGHESAYEASQCPKWLKKRDAMCRCDEVSALASEQWDQQWGGPVHCCIRAGLDCASAPSAGVLGFTAGDLRRMYPEGVPDWISQPGQNWFYWPSNEENGTFADMADSAAVVL